MLVALKPINSFMGSRLFGTTKHEEVGSEPIDRSGIEKESGRVYVLARPLNPGRIVSFSFYTAAAIPIPYKFSLQLWRPKIKDDPNFLLVSEQDVYVNTEQDVYVATEQDVYVITEGSSL